MTRLLCIIGLLLLLAYAANSQCTASAGFQCVPQADMDRISKDLTELKAAREALAAFANERKATDAERASATNALKIADEAMAILQKGIADREAVIALQQKALQTFADLVERLTQKLNQPRSAWSKFVQAVEKIAVLALGISIGHGL